MDFDGKFSDVSVGALTNEASAIMPGSLALKLTEHGSFIIV